MLPPKPLLNSIHLFQPVNVTPPPFAAYPTIIFSILHPPLSPS